MDYDRYSDTLPVLGTAAAVAMDGAHFHARHRHCGLRVEAKKG